MATLRQESLRWESHREGPRREIELEPPVGEVNYTPAQPPPRPALRIVRDALPPSLGRRLASARELARRHRAGAEPPLPTAEPLLDRVLGGGLARGGLVEIVGRRSSGRFALVLTALAAATGSGEAAALVDLGDGLDPQAAAACGVDLERLLWLRPRRLREALAGAEAALACGFPLVAVDLGTPPLRGGRRGEGVWLRLVRAAREKGAALLVSAPYRVSGPAAAAVLTAGRERAVWLGREAAPRVLEGVAVRLTVEKLRGATPGESGTLRLTTGKKGKRGKKGDRLLFSLAPAPGQSRTGKRGTGKKGDRLLFSLAPAPGQSRTVAKRVTCPPFSLR